MTRYSLCNYVQIIANVALGTRPLRLLAVSVAIFSLVVELSDQAQSIIKLPSLKFYPSCICRNPRETNPRVRNSRIIWP